MSRLSGSILHWWVIHAARDCLFRRTRHQMCKYPSKTDKRYEKVKFAVRLYSYHFFLFRGVIPCANPWNGLRKLNELSNKIGAGQIRIQNLLIHILNHVNIRFQSLLKPMFWKLIQCLLKHSIFFDNFGKDQILWSIIRSVAASWMGTPVHGMNRLKLRNWLLTRSWKII